MTPRLYNSTAKRVLAHVSNRTGVPVDIIQGPCRTASFVRARRRAMRLFRRMGYSLPDIGEAMHRDHTTVLHHVRSAAR